MQLGYSWLQKSLTSFPTQLMVVLGLLVFPFTMWTEKRTPSIEPIATKQLPPVSPDPRTVRLKKFFTKLHCPVLDLADEFVHAADENQLDWRLLPSISVIESGGWKGLPEQQYFRVEPGTAGFPDHPRGYPSRCFQTSEKPAISES